MAFYKACERLIRFPTLVRLLPKACRRVSKSISRRQYLSRMDRFQHGRSGANFRSMWGQNQSKNAAVLHLFVASFQITNKTSEMLHKPLPIKGCSVGAWVSVRVF